MTSSLCDACLVKTRDDERIRIHATGLESDPDPQLVATYCRRCWGALFGSLRVLEHVIRA